MKKKLSVMMAIILVLTLIVGTAGVAGATNSQKLNNINQQLKTAKNQLAQSKQKAGSLSSQINTLDRKISATEGGIVQTQNEIDATLKQIEVKIQELEKKNQEILKQNDDLNARLRAMYKNGEAGYLEVLLGSEDFSQLMDNIDKVSMIYQQDEEFMDILKKQYDQIAQTKKELENLNVQLESKQAQLETQKKTLQSEKSEAETLRASVQTDIKAQNELIDELNEAAEEISALIKASQSTTTSFVGGAFCIPAPSYTRISSYYGYRIHPITGTKKMHTGIDFAAPANTACVAANSGTVTYAGWYSGYGNTVVIDHGGGISTLYGHNNSLLVSKGTKVSKGQQIAKIGSTGNSTGPHCHFEVRVNGKYTNPMSYLGGK